MNLQTVMKQHIGSGEQLAVHHLFSTIQGEGPYTGERAIFVRLYGCNLQCPLCDTDYSSQFTMFTPEQVYRNVCFLIGNDKAYRTGYGGYLVVISGGEPFRQNIAPLVKRLLAGGFRVQVETNGTLWLDELPWSNPDFMVVCSPKTGKLNGTLARKLQVYKYVLHADEISPVDGLPLRALGHSAEPHVARPPPGFSGRIYVHPVDTGDAVDNRRHLEAVIHRSCIRFGYTLGVQLHKLVNLE